MNIVVQGCGAMGSVYAALFSEAGHSVWVMGRNAEHMRAIKHTGLRVSGASGDRIVTPMVTEYLPEVGIDLLILSVKAGSVAEAAASLLAGKDRITRVVTIQNGLGSGDTLVSPGPSTNHPPMDRSPMRSRQSLRRVRRRELRHSGARLGLPHLAYPALRIPDTLSSGTTQTAFSGAQTLPTADTLKRFGTWRGQ